MGKRSVCLIGVGHRSHRSTHDPDRPRPSISHTQHPHPRALTSTTGLEGSKEGLNAGLVVLVAGASSPPPPPKMLMEEPPPGGASTREVGRLMVMLVEFNVDISLGFGGAWGLWLVGWVGRGVRRGEEHFNVPS